MLVSIEESLDNRWTGSWSDILPPYMNEYQYWLGGLNGGCTEDMYFHFYGNGGGPRHELSQRNMMEPNIAALFGVEDGTIFCEDIFGCQFAWLPSGAIDILDIHGMERYTIADSFEFFIEDAVEDKELFAETRKLADDWSRNGGALAPLKTLSYLIPPLLGGDDGDVANLILVDCMVNVSIAAQIIQAVKGLNPGTILDDVNIDFSSGIIEFGKD